MSLMRSVFLKASESAWLRERAVRYGFMRRSVARFMPGEKLEDAITAGETMAEDGVFSVLTHLGENVTQPSDAEEATQAYIEALEKIREASLAAEISVKLTQLGLDLDAELCFVNLMRIMERSSPERTVWIDMEHAPYVDVTLSIYRRMRDKHRNIGVCLQAYLFRTERDLAGLIAIGASVRLVKGAYSEPPEIAFAEKADMDANFLELAQMLLSSKARRAGVRAAIATHDVKLIARICEWAAKQGIAKNEIEFQMLYGIQRAELLRLAKEGYHAGSFISYGSHWFPWFMRRLAERPANVFFVARNLLGG
jgi:proline dehydrogenase